MTLIPKQIQIPYIGAVYELLNRVSFLYALVSQLLMTRLYYYNQGDTLLKNTFNSYWFFLGFLLLICWILSLFSWSCIIPSQNKFCQEQAIIDGRSPLYDKVCEIERKIDELKK